MAYYLNPIRNGTNVVRSLGDGYTININWYQAFPSTDGYLIAYNIYYSIFRDNVFSEGVKYVSIDDSLSANLIGLVPGQEYFLAVRPVEYSPTIYNLSLLPIAYDNLRIYPGNILRQDISATTLTIPLMDVTDFPSAGIIKVGVELIQYSSVSYISNNLSLSSINQRGFDNTIALSHTVDGYDGYRSWDSNIPFYVIGEAREFDRIYAEQSRFEYPNYAVTAADGYKQVIKDNLSTDLTASDTENSTFRMYDYSGYHRTDPVQLLNGECVGSYSGGEYGCIDEFGNSNILRGSSLQEQNNQRQEILLSLTGRPAALLKRAQSGIMCRCYISSSEYPDDRCPSCFVPGTLVRTESGYRPIEDIKIGDKVLTSKGAYKQVTATYKNQYNGDLVSIDTHISPRPILTTPEHPFLALRGNHKLKNGCSHKNCNTYIQRGDGNNDYARVVLLPSGNWQSLTSTKGVSKSLGTYSTQEIAKQIVLQYKNENLIGHQLNWDVAKNIKANDWLVPRYDSSISDLDHIDIPQEYLQYTNRAKKRAGPITFDIDEEFMWIIGLYLAEGSVSGTNLNFSIHKKEIEFKNKVLTFFTKHGYNNYVYESKTSNGLNIAIMSATLSKWFPKWLGIDCYNKHIPEELMKLPENKIRALISGIYDGDGIKRSNEIKQTSKILALQLIEILHRIGENPLARKYNDPRPTPKGTLRQTAYSVDWGKDNKNNLRGGRWHLNNDNLVRVKSSVLVPNYSGYVYNLEVEDDHTYIVEGIVVHNCNGTKFVTGYEQYFNPRRSDGRILVHTGPNEENLKMYEGGLESELTLDTWTLTIPTIKTRDVLILFDVDDNEEFRYEVMSVSRGNTLLGQEGAQKMRIMRIRKTDPAYQVRAFRNTSMYPASLSTGIGFTTNILPHTHQIVKNEKDPSTWSQKTSVSQGHSHDVIVQSGLPVVQITLSHAHQIIIT